MLFIYCWWYAFGCCLSYFFPLLLTFTSRSIWEIFSNLFIFCLHLMPLQTVNVSREFLTPDFNDNSYYQIQADAFLQLHLNCLSFPVFLAIILVLWILVSFLVYHVCISSWVIPLFYSELSHHSTGFLTLLLTHTCLSHRLFLVCMLRKIWLPTKSWNKLSVFLVVLVLHTSNNWSVRNLIFFPLSLG